MGRDAGQASDTRIKVVVVDDHELVRSGVEMSLELHPDLVIVAQASTGEDAVAVCEATRPDVVLMDLVLPGMDGVQATAEILSRVPTTRVLALTTFSDPDLIQRAVKAGATGYVLKNVSANELAKAIRQTHAGVPALAPEVAEVLMQALTAPAPPGALLTEREREVLALIAEGLTNAEIADRLVLALSTVKTHVSSILTKLGASGRAEVVAIALRDHLI
jgi:two-component system, NarL family, response regulator LiaR